MKWENKGHEFEEIGSKIGSYGKIAIFGAGYYGGQVYALFEKHTDIVCFIDGSGMKQEDGYLGKPVYSWEDFKLINRLEDIMVLVAVLNKDEAKKIIEESERFGLKENKDIFNINEFNGKASDRFTYLSVYMLYRYKKLFTNICVYSVTERCSLNCKHCQIFTSLYAAPKDIDIEVVKHDIDLFFSAVDYVDSFHILGGEPLLHPGIIDIIEYIHKKYRKQILHDLSILTNGVVKLSEEMFLAFKEYDIQIIISDYSKQLPQHRERISSFIDGAVKHKVKLRRYDYVNWIDFGRDTADNNWDGDKLTKWFDSCDTYCKLFMNGKFYNCQDDAFALRAGITDSDSGFDLQNFKWEEKTALLEYMLGYSEKGYVELCKKCNGNRKINSKYISVAEQA